MQAHCSFSPVDTVEISHFAGCCLCQERLDRQPHPVNSEVTLAQGWLSLGLENRTWGWMDRGPGLWCCPPAVSESSFRLSLPLHRRPGGCGTYLFLQAELACRGRLVMPCPQPPGTGHSAWAFQGLKVLAPGLGPWSLAAGHPGHHQSRSPSLGLLAAPLCLPHLWLLSGVTEGSLPLNPATWHDVDLKWEILQNASAVTVCFRCPLSALDSRKMRVL